VALTQLPLLLQGFDIYKHFDRMLTKGLHMVTKCVPLKMKAMHVFTGSGKTVLEQVFPVLKQIIGKELRLLTNIHVS
jgi:hypothetical protein